MADKKLTENDIRRHLNSHIQGWYNDLSDAGKTALGTHAMDALGDSMLAQVQEIREHDRTVAVDPEALRLARGVVNAGLQGPVPLATVSALASEVIRLGEGTA